MARRPAVIRKVHQEEIMVAAEGQTTQVRPALAAGVAAAMAVKAVLVLANKLEVAEAECTVAVAVAQHTQALEVRTAAVAAED